MKPDSQSLDVLGAFQKFLEATEEMKHEAWRMSLRNYKTCRERCRAETDEDRQALFKDLAKQGHLTCEEVINGTYLIFGNAEEQRWMANLLLHKPPLERIRLHNWHIAVLNGETFTNDYGPILDKLVWPLFPSGDLSGVNIKLLREVSTTNVEGGASPQWTPSVYRSTTPQLSTRRKAECEPEGGAVHFPVVADHTGAPVVDVESISTAYNETTVHGKPTLRVVPRPFVCMRPKFADQK